MAKKYTVAELISRLGDLPTMPDVAMRVLALIRNPNTDMEEISNILSLDQSMSILVLRWANSAYYGLRHPATTVKQAVVVLGQQAVRNVIISSSLSSLMNKPLIGYGLDSGELWKHSIAVAGAAREIAKDKGSAVAEEAYTAGLLADVGKLAFEKLLRNVDLSDPGWQGRSFTDLEENFFGISHTQLGAELASRWNIPAQLLDAISHHHDPIEAKEGRDLAYAVHLADYAVMMLGIGLGRDGLQYALEPAAVEYFNFDETTIEKLTLLIPEFIESAETLIRK